MASGIHPDEWLAAHALTQTVRFIESRAWLDRMHSPNVRRRDAAEAVTRAHEARAEFTALFTARFGLTLPDEWCDRWWPATALWVVMVAYALVRFRTGATEGTGE